MREGGGGREGGGRERGRREGGGGREGGREGMRGREGGRERGGVKEDPNNINTHLSISTICIFTGSITNTHTHTDRWSVRERKGEREEGRRGKEGGGKEGEGGRRDGG